MSLWSSYCCVLGEETLTGNHCVFVPGVSLSVGLVPMLAASLCQAGRKGSGAVPFHNGRDRAGGGGCLYLTVGDSTFS